MDPDGALRTLENLRIVRNREQGYELRHQPLAVLQAIERVRRGGPRMVLYEDVRESLRRLIGDLGGGTGRPDPSVTVNVLTRPLRPAGGEPLEPIWEIEGWAALPKRRRVSTEDVSDRTLRERHVRVGLTAGFADLLRSDSAFAERAEQALLDSYFGTEEHTGVRLRVRQSLLALVRAVWQVRENIETFVRGASAEPSTALSLARQTTFWIYDPDADAFGPSKFCGFEGMSFGEYGFWKGAPEGMGFDGHRTRKAVEEVTGSGYAADDALSSRLDTWADALLGPDALSGVSKHKWVFNALPPSRRYWALLANPDRFDIVRALRGLSECDWIVGDSDVKAGDRVAIWKAKGKGDEGGVIALGEVVSEAESRTVGAGSARYWRDGLSGEDHRVARVAFVRPVGAPLWLGGKGDGVLRDLSVARATGGSMFRITPPLWHDLVRALGGWPDAQDDEDAAADAAADAANQRSGQGFGGTPEARRAVELHAEAHASAYFDALGFKIEKRGKPFDLLCTRGGKELYVEVKGSRAAVGAVFVTKNEVDWARAHGARMALYVLDQIAVTDSEPPVASGGVARVWWPWDIDSGLLTPVTYRYALPLDEDCV